MVCTKYYIVYISYSIIYTIYTLFYNSNFIIPFFYSNMLSCSTLVFANAVFVGDGL